MCSNEVPGVINGHALRGHNFIQVYIAETLKNLFLMNHWPECIDIWYGSSIGLGDSGLYK